MSGAQVVTPQDTARLRILATSDLHMHLAPWDYLADQPSPAVGLARTASLIAQARAEVAECLLLDNGDFLQGSPLGDLIALGSGSAPNPMITVMNHLSYDAATLGNHEFSHGLPYLIQALDQAAFPIVSANIFHAAHDPTGGDVPFRPPWVIVTRTLTVNDQPTPLRIGLIGFAPPQLVLWEHQHIAGQISTRDILQAADLEVPRLRAAGADLVIALAHTGIGADQAEPCMENASAALAALDGIDALIMGHTHQTFPSSGFRAAGSVDPQAGTLSGKPAVMPGFFGGHLGVIDLWLTHDGARWQIMRHTSVLRAIAQRDCAGRVAALVASDPEVEALAAPAHARTRDCARARVAGNSRRMDSYFALVMACAPLRLVAQAQAVQVIRALDGTCHAGLPVLSAVAPFRAGGRSGPDNYTVLPIGDVQMRHLSDLYIHPNTLTAIEISGAELGCWLERSASLFHQITPGLPDQPLIDPDFPSFNFDCIEGVTYRIDLSQPARHDARGGLINPNARRIRQLRFQSRAVAADDRFVLATNSYRTGGGSGFAGAELDRVILSTGLLVRDVLHDFITAQGCSPAKGRANWRFGAMPGTSVIFPSAPAAADHLPNRHIEPLETTADGFRRFRLHL